LILKSKKIPIAQCNNALIYPGIGLGVLIAQATRLSEAMLWEACNALSHFANQSSEKKDTALLPNFEEVQAMSRCIALAVDNASTPGRISKSECVC